MSCSPPPNWTSPGDGKWRPVLCVPFTRVPCRGGGEHVTPPARPVPAWADPSTRSWPVFEGSELPGRRSASSAVFRERGPDLPLHRSGDEQCLGEAHVESQRCQGRGGQTPLTGPAPGSTQLQHRWSARAGLTWNRQGTPSTALPQVVQAVLPPAEEQALASRCAQARPVRFCDRVRHITTILGLASETSNAPHGETAQATVTAFGVHVGAIPGHSSVERIDDRARGAGAGGLRTC